MLIDFCSGSRGNTGVHLRDGDVQLVDEGKGGHLVRLRALKGEVLIDDQTGREKLLQYPPGAVDGMVSLIQKWEYWRAVLGLRNSG
eukprot:SAG31_NODE_22294_length_529_cov_0.851163_1_plen_85_part_10